MSVDLEFKVMELEARIIELHIIIDELKDNLRSSEGGIK